MDIELPSLAELNSAILDRWPGRNRPAPGIRGGNARQPQPDLAAWRLSPPKPEPAATGRSSTYFPTIPGQRAPTAHRYLRYRQPLAEL